MPPYPESLKSIFIIAIAFVPCQIHFMNTQRIFHRIVFFTQARKPKAGIGEVTTEQTSSTDPGAAVTLSFCLYP